MTALAIPFPGREYNLRHQGDELPFHPLANIFPLLEGVELVALKDDIAANGLREPIVVLDGLILDGRNRFLACHAVALERGWPDSGVRPPVRFVKYNGKDPLGFVLSLNLHRRHLNESQRAMVAAKLATLDRGRPINRSIGPITQPQAAEKLNVGAMSVKRARAVIDRGTPELQRAVERGDIPVSVAEKLTKLEPEKQAEAAAKPKEAPHMAKKAARKERERALAAKQQALPAKKYGVIVADPEWRFEPRSRETGMDRSPDNHYPTNETEAIAARDVASIAADDCVLFLWATAPMLPQALHVMERWGFAYKTHCIWHKERSGNRHGTGYWFFGEHELLLVGTRGKVVPPAQGTQWHSVIAAPVGRHSEKPEIFRKLVEELFPSLPKIELNARRRRPGWDAWGNELEETSEVPWEPLLQCQCGWMGPPSDLLICEAQAHAGRKMCPGCGSWMNEVINETPEPAAAQAKAGPEQTASDGAVAFGGLTGAGGPGRHQGSGAPLAPAFSDNWVELEIPAFLRRPAPGSETTPQ